VTVAKASREKPAGKPPAGSVRKTIGRKLSRRDVEFFETEYGDESQLERSDPDDIWGTTTIERHRQRAIRTLRAAGIDAHQFDDDSPKGSSLLEHVLWREDHEIDSPIGLAARIYEICCHLLAYQTMGGDKLIPGLAYRLGRLVILAKAYGPESERQRDIARRPRKAITKRDLEQYRDRWKQLHAGSEHGWRTAAARRFKISDKTLKNKLPE
jgi:hypothetical protein